MNSTNEQTIATITPVKQGDNIVIIGRKWFDKSRGSTYFSAVGLINGIEVVNIPYEYGYDNHYMEQVFEQMRTLGYIPDVIEYPNSYHESLREYCENHGITLYYTATHVTRRKDL